MKKLLPFLFVFFFLSSCTNHEREKQLLQRISELEEDLKDYEYERCIMDLERLKEVRGRYDVTKFMPYLKEVNVASIYIIRGDDTWLQFRVPFNQYIDKVVLKYDDNEKEIFRDHDLKKYIQVEDGQEYIDFKLNDEDYVFITNWSLSDNAKVLVVGADGSESDLSKNERYWIQKAIWGYRVFKPEVRDM